MLLLMTLVILLLLSLHAERDEYPFQSVLALLVVPLLLVVELVKWLRRRG